MSSVADTTPNGAPNNFQFLGRAEHTRVLTAKTRFCHTYEGSVREREPGDFSSISPKVAATSSPTTQCSTIGDAVSLSAPSLCPVPSPLSAPLSPAPAPSPARRRRAHRRPPRASDALREGYGATRSWDIKDMVSLKKVSLSFSSDHWAHEVIVELVASWEV